MTCRPRMCMALQHTTRQGKATQDEGNKNSVDVFFIPFPPHPLLLRLLISSSFPFQCCSSCFPRASPLHARNLSRRVASCRVTSCATAREVYRTVLYVFSLQFKFSLNSASVSQFQSLTYRSEPAFPLEDKERRRQMIRTMKILVRYSVMWHQINYEVRARARANAIPGIERGKEGR